MPLKPYILVVVAWCGLVLLSCSRQADEQAHAWYEQGKALREQGKPDEAMEAFLKAADSGTKDEALLGRIWSNMANMCRQANNHVKAYEVYAVSAEHFLAARDTLAYAYALNNMAWEQAVMGYKDTALMLIGEAMQAYPRSPLTDKVTETRAAACFFTQDYDSVLYYTTPPANDYLLMLRAQAYSLLGQDDSATAYAQQLLPRTTNLFYLDDLYYILLHNDAQADKDSVVGLSSERADVQKQIERRHGQLTVAVQRLERYSTSGRLSVQILSGLILAFIGVILGFTAWLLHHQRRLLSLEKQARDNTLRQEMQQNVDFLREADDLRGELSWSDYTAFCRQTDSLFHGLATRLQQQGLNEQDIRMCVLVLIGLSHKQTADFMNCSPKSIGKLKDLTAHKLGVSGGQLREKLEQLI